MLLEPAPVPSVVSSRALNSIVLGLGLLAAGCDRQSDGPAQPQASATAEAPKAKAAPAEAFDRMFKGTPLPDVTFKDPAGKTLNLKDLKGPVLVNLWATWCAPCVVELPQLDKLAKDGLRVVTVSQDLEGGAKVAEFLKGKGLAHLEPWLDPENQLMGTYGSGTLPTSVYYDASGREVWRLLGEHDWTSPITAKVLAEKN
jgi:thiol-disulfide isomerase/thioredoxin